jgi:hypothetical protein
VEVSPSDAWACGGQSARQGESVECEVVLSVSSVAFDVVLSVCRTVRKAGRVLVVRE